MPEPRLLPDRRLVPLLSALMSALLLSELDHSMVAAALPTIVAELDGVGDLMWVNTAFLLAATGVLPIYGALGDRRGRRPVIIVALVLILAGSVLGALAPSMLVLVLARVVQGLGAGGMLVLVQAAVADVLPVRDRVPVMSMIGAVFAVGAAAGPLLGGWLAEGPGWRWMFWLNVPIALLAVVACRRLLPPPGTTVRPPRLRAADLLPVRFFADRTFTLVAGGGLVLGLATFGLFGYLPTYLQLGLGLTPMQAGLWMLTLVGGLGIGTLLSAQLVGRTGVQRPLTVIGASLAAVALVGLALPGTATVLGLVGVCLAVLGLGAGLAWEVLVVMVQNTVAQERVGAATALNGFSREIGVLLGSAMVGGMLSAGLAAGGEAVAVLRPAFVGLAVLSLLSAALLAAARPQPLDASVPRAGREIVRSRRR
ncbi:MAG TPA: MFS transporter [Microlunatus sp.]|nr:MFS transporter [Microlunatus sp.]